MRNQTVKPKRKRVAKVFPHGATKPVERHGEWVYFSSTVAGGEDYPVVFQVKDLPKLIRWLQAQVQ